MNDQICTGVSSACFYPMETLCAVRQLCAWKIPNIEIFFNSPRELKEEYVQKLHQLCQQSGTQVVSVHPFTSGIEPLFFFSEYPGRFEDGIELYEGYLRAAKKLGAKLLVFHGDSPYSKIPQEKAFDQLRRFDRFALEQYGVRVAYENVVRCRGRDPQYFASLREYYPEMRFVLDIKQALRSGRLPSEYIRLLGDSICHVHISDSTAERDCLPVGGGEMNLHELLQELKEQGFHGSVLQEVYRDSYEHPQQVLEGYRALEKMVSELNGPTFSTK